MPLPFDDFAAWPLEATTASSSRAGEEDPLPSLAVAAGVTALTAAAVPVFDPACSAAGSLPFTEVPPAQIPLLIVGYGFGASFVALFAQLGLTGDFWRLR